MKVFIGFREFTDVFENIIHNHKLVYCPQCAVNLEVTDLLGFANTVKAYWDDESNWSETISRTCDKCGKDVRNV